MREAQQEKTFNVAWGRNQREHLGTDTVKAANEQAARRQVRQSLENRFFQHHGMKILYVYEIDPLTGKEVGSISNDLVIEGGQNHERYVIKHAHTYRTFVGDGKRWSSREKDGEIFSNYNAVMAKIAKLKAENPKLKCFSQMID